MTDTIRIELSVPDDLSGFHLPKGVSERLQELLDRQDAGQPLSPAEQREAEGLVDLAELLSLLRMRSERIVAEQRQPS